MTKRSEIVGAHRIAQQAIVINSPVVENETNYRVVANAVIFRNSGTSNVELNGGWSLSPGEAVAFNCNNAYDVIVQNFTIMFSGAGVNRLEVATMETANCPALDNYIQNIRIR